MADVPSAKNKLNDIEISSNAPHSETLWNRTAGSLNYLIDTTDTNDTRLTAIEGGVNQVTVSASPTSLSTWVTIYTCPSGVTATVGVRFKNLPDAAGTKNMSARAVINGINCEITTGTGAITSHPWYDNGAAAGATGTYLEAVYIPTITLTAGETIQVFRVDRGALDLDIVEFDEF